MSSLFLVLSVMAAQPDAGGGLDFKVIPIVAPAYTAELGFLINAGGVAGWQTASAPRSSLAVIAGVSTIGVLLSQARLTSFWLEDRVRLSALVDVRDQPDHYFGVGFANGLTRVQSAANTSYRRTAWQVAPVLQVRMKEGLPLFFGTVLEHSGTFSRQLSVGVEADPDFQQRGGARVIYYWYVPGERVYLIHAYAKNEQADLTREQIKTLATLMKDIKHG